MIPFALGLGAVAALLWGAGAFARADVRTVKAVLAWVAALLGLVLMAGLFLTGRGAVATSGLVLVGPLAWRWVKGRVPGVPAPSGPRMSRAEALSILGLSEGASDSDVQAAWVRLMRSVHPDGGGTDWLASRVNQARDTLLRRR